MSKLLKKLCMVGIAFVLALSVATMPFTGGGDPPPVEPDPPTASGSVK
ncbi:hypothetical protein KAX02_10105 [candidate division WOR-3 bacterium]|nr:hypothetical protein [candidate division WOR-3 bacterium]